MEIRSILTKIIGLYKQYDYSFMYYSHYLIFLFIFSMLLSGTKGFGLF